MNRRKNIARLVAVGSALAAVVGGGLIVSQTATADDCSSRGGSENSPDDKGGVDAVAIIPSSCAPDAPRAYRVDFYAYDEVIQIDDNASDGHKAKAYLSVEGFGTATYTTKNFREEDLNFPEGRKVSIKVCAQGTSKCSYWYAGKT